MAARSTIAGTPVKSCMSTRPGVKLISRSDLSDDSRAAARKGLIEWLGRVKPDVLCLQETKAAPEQLGPELTAVAGYECEWHWAEKKGYSGVGTYTATSTMGIQRGLGIPKYDAEGRV